MTSKDDIVARLSGNALAVIHNRRVVFVEDQDDQDFHGATYNVLIQRKLIATSPYLFFQRVSIGEGPGKLSGGKDKVREVVKQLHIHGIGPVVMGLIDRDNANPSSQGVVVLQRYSWENYLLDPLVVFCAGLEAGHIFTELSHLPKLLRGDEHAVRLLPRAQQQAIADHILGAVEATLTSPFDSSPYEVVFEAHQLQYRRWLIDKQGKTLMARFQSVFTFAERKNLWAAFDRLQMVPHDLRDVYQALLGG